MVLSCALGVKTLVLDAQPNDNGLFHEVLMDYDVPGAWPTLEDDTDLEAYDMSKIGSGRRK